MKQEDKLRNTLREYYDNQEVPFNDDDWLGASAKLNEARRKKKIGRYAIVFTIATSLLVGLFTFFFNSQTPTAGQKQLAGKPAPENTSPTPISEPALLPAPATPVQKTVPRVHQDEHTNTAPQPAIMSTTTTSEKAGGLATHLPARSTTPVRTEQRSQPAMQEPEREQSPPTVPDLLPPPVMQEKTAADPKDGPAREMQEGIAWKEETVTAIEHSPPGPTPAANDKPSAPPPAAAIAESNVALNDARNETPASMPAASSLSSDTLLSAMKPAGIPVPAVDTTDHTETTESTTPIHPIEPLAEGLFLEAGVAWFNGWKGPQARDARGFSPIAGLHYMSRLGHRSSFSFGLAYVMVPDLANSSKTSRVSTYEYGEQSNVTVIAPSSVHYLVAPLRLHYVVNRKNSLGVGVNVAWLLNVNSNITTYKEIPGSTWDYKHSKLGGYTQGFSLFDSQLAFCYRRRFNRAMALQAEVFLGLTDVKQDDFFGYTGKEKNSGAKLSFIYNIFRKSNNP